MLDAVQELFSPNNTPQQGQRQLLALSAQALSARKWPGLNVGVMHVNDEVVEPVSESCTQDESKCYTPVLPRSASYCKGCPISGLQRPRDARTATPMDQCPGSSDEKGLELLVVGETFLDGWKRPSMGDAISRLSCTNLTVSSQCATSCCIHTPVGRPSGTLDHEHHGRQWRDLPSGVLPPGVHCGHPGPGN